MWEWLILGVIVALLGIGLWRFARLADRVEDDSSGMVDSRKRAPYGSKWLSIFAGTDKNGRNDEH